eukprot:c28297_g1_i2 orf=667-2055(+)
MSSLGAAVPNSLLLLSVRNEPCSVKFANLCLGKPTLRNPRRFSYSRLHVRVLSQRKALESISNVVTDKTVGHRELHGFLDGEAGAEFHGLKSQELGGREGEDDGSTILPLHDYVQRRENMEFTGIYAVYDMYAKLQYIGYSRNIIKSLKCHKDQVEPAKCSFVRVKLFSDPDMISQNRLEDEKQRWLQDWEVPPGNSNEKALWEMSDEEKVENQEKTLRLRNSMGQNLHRPVVGEDTDAGPHRLKLSEATEEDDWSTAIDGQTEETCNGQKESGERILPVSSNEEGQTKPSEEQVVSPFVKPNTQISDGLYSAASFELTLENVDVVLNDVRPYLIADGGNVEVISLESGVVSLLLQGACGSCPSSTVTMKMGIERVLKEKFGDAFKEVIQVDQKEISATIKTINAHLDILRPAIHNYGGSVEVLSVGGGECQVKFKGPPPIGVGIQAAIKDKFPEISSVVLV